MTLFGDLRFLEAYERDAQRELIRITAALKAAVPGVAIICVTSSSEGWSVAFFDLNGEVLDASNVPWEEAEAAARLFGFGCYTLKGTGLPATRIRSVKTR